MNRFKRNVCYMETAGLFLSLILSIATSPVFSIVGQNANFGLESCPNVSDSPFRFNVRSTNMGLDLEYLVRVANPETHTIQVRLRISNLQVDRIVLTFLTGAARWTDGFLSPEKNVRNLIARGESGKLLGVKAIDDGIDWTGDGIEVSTGNEEVVIIDYDVKIGFENSEEHLVKTGYLNSKLGVVEPEFIFYCPVHVEVNSTRVSFELPEGWIPVSHWRIEGSYSKVDFQSGELTAGALGFGEYTVRSSMIGGVNVTVATVDLNSDKTEKAAKHIFGLFDYYTRTIRSAPIQGYVVIFVPNKVDGWTVVPYNEAAYGYFWPWEHYTLYWADVHAHCVCHQWISGTMQGVIWFQEGFTNYYELRASESVGIFFHDQVDRELCRRFSTYAAEILGTKYDVSLEDASSGFTSERMRSQYGFLVYEKGSLVAHLLNNVLMNLTDGTINIDDVTRYLYEKHGLKNRGIGITSDDILKATNIVSGYDFTHFFSNYVFGIERLPFEIKNNRLVIVESCLPTLEKLPKDSDRDGLLDDEEKNCGTDPNNRDTDNDGLFDGEEVHGYRKIFIDGVSDDWQGIKPLWVDERNDFKYKVPNTDLKSLTIYFDCENLCFMIELHEGKPNLEDSYDLMFDLDSDESPDYVFNCQPKGYVNMWNLTSSKEYIESNRIGNPEGVEIFSDDVVEVKIPFGLIGNARVFGLASHVFVSFVKTENDLFLPRWVKVPLDTLFPLQRTDPLNPDTDGDGVKDGEDPNPLDPMPENASKLIVNAEEAVRRAEQEGRTQGLDMARQKLAEARSAYNSGLYDVTISLAKETLDLAESAAAPATQPSWLQTNWLYIALVAIVMVVVILVAQKPRRKEGRG